jgi:hypothetical protein
MQIRVKTLVGRAINLRVEPADTVASLKEKLQAIAGTYLSFLYIIVSINTEEALNSPNPS